MLPSAVQNGSPNEPREAGADGAAGSKLAISADATLDASSSDPAARLNAICVQWRISLAAAEDALAAAADCGTSLEFPAGELAEFRQSLARERLAVSELLNELAREQDVTLERPLTAPRASRKMLGLPEDVLACVFDLDGVLAASATVHAAAWAETFDEFLMRRSDRTGERFAPLTPFAPAEYRLYLHGRRRIEGVHAFLARRGIRIPEGRPDDAPGVDTVYGLGNRKNAALNQLLERHGVTAYDDSRRFLQAAREAGLRCAVVSESANAATIIERAGLRGLVDVCVDGAAANTAGVRGQPRPDMLLAACRELGTSPASSVDFATTADGAAAARAAGFERVIVVDRHGQDACFRGYGADRVVPDLGEMLDRTFLGDGVEARCHGDTLALRRLGHPAHPVDDQATTRRARVERLVDR